MLSRFPPSNVEDDTTRPASSAHAGIASAIPVALLSPHRFTPSAPAATSHVLFVFHVPTGRSMKAGCLIDVRAPGGAGSSMGSEPRYTGNLSGASPDVQPKRAVLIDRAPTAGQGGPGAASSAVASKPVVQFVPKSISLFGERWQASCTHAFTVSNAP